MTAASKHILSSLPPRIVLVLFSLTAATVVASAQEERESFVRWAKSHATPILHIEDGGDDADLKPLRQIVGGARVVALGEPAHGVHETLAFRNRIFRYLVENLGFTAITLEAGLAESGPVNDFVNGAPGSARAAADALTWGPAPAENVELINWVHTYNANSAHRQKVHIYGVDMQLIGVPGDTTPRHAALDEALSYLARVDAAEERRARGALAPCLSRLSVSGYAALSREEHDALSAAIEDLIALFERGRVAFLALTPEATFEWAYRNALVARQTDQMVRIQPLDTPGAIPAGAWRAASARDAAMADNVRWVTRQEGPRGRVLVYAHNAHVKNAVTEGGVWSAFERPPNAMGQYLRSMLGDDLVIIGTSSNSSTVVTQPVAVDDGSLEATLALVGPTCFLLNLRAPGRDPAAAHWLAQPRKMAANLMTHQRLSVGTAFDAIFFVEKLTPVHRPASP
jgi:erythromycin esterase